MKKTLNNGGFIIVIVIFIISVMLGGLLLNQKLISNKFAKLKSNKEGFLIQKNLENINTLIFHEMSVMKEKLESKEYLSIIEYFSKNPENKSLWHNNIPEKNNDKSLSQYSINKIISGKSKELYTKHSSITAFTAINNTLKNGKGGKFTIILEKKIEFVSGIYNKKLLLKPYILLTFHDGNIDLTSPNSESIEKIEVIEND
ncbi:hypothetical protein [Fusobacterium sp. PH5-44]|uniref:hypothetical protein n=1 Tax=unclassified Fusobacterium TaxID=2648384 RepID=UPI003D1F5067